MNFNVIIVAFRGESMFLLNKIRALGDFQKTDFRDVLSGSVSDIFKFHDELKNLDLLSLSRIVFVNKVFGFKDKEELLARLSSELENVIPEIKGSFRVTCERRGHKGTISSMDIEKQVAEFILKKNPDLPVNLEAPEFELVIEILGNQCGIFLLTPSLRKELYLFRTK